ncbi:MAG TPA: four helix bundle protein [Verrucomicrobia bacterium]|nr:four helix bundle protein [Verrucomicrobiota bacterium]HOP98546.1 four helix bundle protein [Verrucomicrobiota bacterium]HPU55587.1 four helix bundle protein [Verrucomicrobiota bacterium]
MPKYQKFEDLPVWQEAARLYNRVLDLIEESPSPLSPGFRNQLDRAAISVSNHIAEGFERANELNSFLAIARASAGEVRSMVAVVKDRPRFKPLARHLEEIRALAESCAKQLAAWTASIEGSPAHAKRQPSDEEKRQREGANKAREFRRDFPRNLRPGHPLSGSSEARGARGDGERGSA